MHSWIPSISLCLGAMFLASGCDQSQKAPDFPQKALRAHSLVFQTSPEGDITIPSGCLDHLVTGQEVILTGEGHGMSVNYQLRRAFLTYLKDRIDLDYLLLEVGPSQAGTLNHYLKTGDTGLLDALYRYWEGTYEWTQESYDSWPYVYAFNQTLPLTRRLVCVGIDVEHQPAHAVAYLKGLMPDVNCPAQIALAIQRVRQSLDDPTDCFDVGSQLCASMAEHTQVYRDYLGDAFFEFQRVTDSIEAARQAYSARQSDGDRTAFSQLRDRQMFDNFVAYHEHLPPGTFWGHFGTAHVFKKSTDGVTWLAASLQAKDSPVADHVLSIYFAYQGGERMTRRSPGYGTSVNPVLSPELLDFHAGPDPVLIDLLQLHSKVRTHPMMASLGAAASTPYVDCLLLIKDPSPTEPLVKR
ncbi:MAG: erythromycin esterase family protein [Phycisphaerae bacterium]|nr:erythromycin esterase family protein [Phycisphaerae bacterium]